MAGQIAMPWVKIWTEILDDRKLRALSERAKWRFIQLILLAGICDQEGELRDSKGPLTLDDIAWRLHVSPEILKDDLNSLQGLVQCTHGVSESNGDLWIVTKFAERQGRSQAEKRELWRVRKTRQRNKDSVTQASPVTPTYREEVEGEEEKEKDEESPPPPPSAPNVFRAYESEIGMLTPKISDELSLAEKEYTAEWVIKAIGEAAEHNKRSWSYIAAILRTWKVEGFKTKKNGNGNGHKPETGSSTGNPLADYLEKRKAELNGQ